MSKDDQSSTPAGSREKLLALLRGCKDAPDDDAVRLVLSDWLEEHGDEDDLARAELIRLQIATNIDHARVRELTQTHRAKWLGPFAKGQFDCEWDRGLLRIECRGGRTVRDALERALDSEVFDWIDHLSLARATWDDLQTLAAMPRLRELGSLDLWSDRGDSAAEIIVGSDAFARLTRLELCGPASADGLGSALSLALRDRPGGDDQEGDESEPPSDLLAGFQAAFAAAIGNTPSSEQDEDEDDPDPADPFTDDGLRALADCPHLDRVTSLELKRGQFTVTELSALARSTRLGRLAELRFYSCGIDAAVLEAFVAAPAFSGLTKLRFGDDPFGPDGAAVLARARHFGELEELDLGFAEIGGEGLTELANSSAFPSLRILDVSYCKLDDTGLFALADSDLLKGLKELDLGTNQGITLEGYRALVESPHVSGLEDFQFTCNYLGDPSAEVLARSSRLGRLRRLQFESNDLTDAGVEALTRATCLEGIERLELQLNQIGDGGARALADCPALSKCVELSLWGSRNAITGEGARALAESPYLSNLRRLDLGLLAIGDEGVLALLRSSTLASLEELSVSTDDLAPEVADEYQARFGGDSG